MTSGLFTEGEITQSNVSHMHIFKVTLYIYVLESVLKVGEGLVTFLW